MAAQLFARRYVNQCVTIQSAISLLAHARRDVEDVIPVLLQLATLAHVTGNYPSRDDSVESAAELIAHCGRLPRSPASALTVPRLPS
jgi:hypothetical protein